MIADVIAGIYAVVNKLRQSIRDKAANDELMQRLGICIEGVSLTIEGVVQGKTMTSSSHPSLREVVAELEAIDGRTAFYLLECTETWRYLQGASFTSEFEGLMVRLDRSLGRLTAAVSVDNAAAMKEVLANTARITGGMNDQLTADLPRLQERMETSVAALEQIQKAQEGQEDTVAPAVQVCLSVAVCIPLRTPNDTVATLLPDLLLLPGALQSNGGIEERDPLATLGPERAF